MQQKNPFFFGSGLELTTGDFCGREKEIADLRSDIEAGMNTLVYASRRYGKTSLLTEVLRRERKGGRKGFYIDLFGVADQNELMNRYFNEFARSIEGAEEKVARLLLGLFTGVKPDIEFRQEAAGEVALGLSVKRSKREQTLAEVIDLPFRYAEKHGETIVVLIDEFQEIVGLGLEKKLRAFITQHGRKVSYLFAGSKKSLLRQMVSESTRPFYQSLKVFPLGGIPLEDWSPFVKAKFKKTGRKIEGEVIRQIFEISQGCPYYVQRLCYYLWRETPEGGIAAESALAIALAHIVVEVRDYQTPVWESLTPVQRKVAKVIASEADDLYSRDVLLDNELTASQMQRGVAGLLIKDVLEKKANKLAFQDPLFAYWLRRA